MSEETRPMTDPDMDAFVEWEMRLLIHTWGEKLTELKLRSANCFGMEKHAQIDGRIIQLEKCLAQLLDAIHMNPVRNETDFGALD